MSTHCDVRQVFQGAYTNSTCCCLSCALQVCRIACGEEVERGSWLWRQGDPADRTAVVLSGTLSVWTRSTAALKPKLERSDGEGGVLGM